MKKVLIAALVIALVGGVSAYALADVYGSPRALRAYMGGGYGGYGMGPGMMGGYGPGYGGGYGMGPGMMGGYGPGFRGGYGMGPGMMGGGYYGGCPGFYGASGEGESAAPADKRISLDKAKEIAESFVKANLPNAKVEKVELERYGFGGFFRADLKLASGETGVLQINPFTGDVLGLRIIPKT